MVWLQVEIHSGDVREKKELVFDLKKNDPSIRVYFSSKEKNNLFDLLVPKDFAEELMKEGLEKLDDTTFEIHERNFKKY